MMAHSNADANILKQLVMETDHGKIVIPKNASAYANPLQPESMLLFSDIAFKRREYCFTLVQEMDIEKRQNT